MPFDHSLAFPFTCSIMCISSGPSCPSGLCIRGSSTKGSDLGQIGGGLGRPAIVVNRVPLAGPPSPHGKGKGKVSEIGYPGGFAYLGVAVQTLLSNSFFSPIVSEFIHDEASGFDRHCTKSIWSL